MAARDSSSDDNAVHERICGWFLGPRAENATFFKELLTSAIDQHVERRESYQNDPPLITDEIQASSNYKDSTKKLTQALKVLNGGLNEGTVPFWSGRYNGHMTNDTTMAALLGYWSTMLSNPNNVAMEAAPFTGLIEKYAGLQLANLLGFNIGNNPYRSAEPMSWGHITCDGSVANLEALWAARNLKFYPLSLCNAIKAESFPPIVAERFKVVTCQNREMRFMELSTWELLNLTVETILDIPSRLKEEFNISPEFLESVLHKFSIQTVGKDAIEGEYQTPGTIEQEYRMVSPKCTVASTRHYSWPKASAVLGIGEAYMIDIPVDNDARVDIKALEDELRKRNKFGQQQAVYMVVVVVGSTEEGSVDPVQDIIELRAKLRIELGMSFVIHVDAAWGGYFQTMIMKTTSGLMPVDSDLDEEYIGILELREDTQMHMQAIRGVDSVTIDPHKSGYIPYPAGALCYRDERMKYLVTWESPYISTQAGVEEIGAYGIEGSKPGAAAVATALSNYVIGLNPEGYGKLLGEASFACSMFSAYWATMETKTFVVVPFNMLPSEPKEKIERYGASEEVQLTREYITKSIIGKSDYVLKSDPIAMSMLRTIGSELIINAFSCNFILQGSTDWNQDVEEANYFNQCIAQRLRVIPADIEAINTTELFITSTVFTGVQYGKCAETFKTRLGLKGSQDLFLLRNVVMSPFVTASVAPNETLLNVMMAVFQNVAEEEAVIRRERNDVRFKDTQQFIMQGTETLHLVYQHLFHMAGHREQIILAVTIPEDKMSKYRAARKADPKKVFVLNCRGNHKQSISTMLKDMKFEATFHELGGASHEEPVLVTVTKILKRRPINSKYLRASIPMEYLPFYLYGTKTEMHMDHMLIEAPSMQLSGDRVTFTPDGDGMQAVRDNINHGLVAILFNSDGSYMPPCKEIHLLPIFDGNGKSNRNGKSVKIYKDPNTIHFDDKTLKHMLEQRPLAAGRMRFSENVLLDSKSPNQIPVPNPDITPLTDDDDKRKNGGKEHSKGKPHRKDQCDVFIDLLREDLGLPNSEVALRGLFL